MKQDAEKRNEFLSAWDRFEHTGKVCDYLRYLAQQNGEGTKNYAGDSQRTGDSGEDAQQR